MRVLSSNAITQINSLESGAAWFYLIEIDHDELPAPYRFVNNTEDVAAIHPTLGMIVWTAYPFRLSLAIDDGQTLPSAEIEFDNVDRALIEVIRGLATSPTINIYAVMSNALGHAELSLTDLQLIDISYDLKSISGKLVAGDLLNASYPCDGYDPAQFPALFF